MRLPRVLVLIGLTLWALTLTPPALAVEDPGRPQQWGLAAVGAPEAWSTGSGTGVTIAVVDTGVDLQHEDLQGRLVPGKNFVDPAKPPQDDHGHGTHVAGVAAAATNNGRGIAGVAPDAVIMPLKAMNSEGKSVDLGNGKDSVTEAIRYAADQHAAVINLSLGDAGITAILGPSFAQAVQYAWGKGSICVVSSGNNGDAKLSNGFVTSSNFSNENALVVTSLTRAGTKPNYANEIGSAKWGIAAPGGAASGKAEDDILSAWWVPDRPNTYAFVAGTSMAAPHVSGAAAILRSLGVSRDKTVEKLLGTARDVGAQGKDSVYGHGALDLKAAVAGLPAKPGPSVSGGGTPPGTQPTTRPTTRPGTGGAVTATTGTLATTPTSAAPLDLPTIEPPDDKTGAAGDDRDDDDDLASAADGGGGKGGDSKPWSLLMLAVLALGAPLVLLGRLKPG